MPRDEDVTKSCDCQDRWNRIQPHAERARNFRSANAQHDESNRLNDELQQNTNDHERRDYVGEWEKAKQYTGT